jgi:hypothetical protein
MINTTAMIAIAAATTPIAILAPVESFFLKGFRMLVL